MTLRILLAEDDAVLGDAIFVHLKRGGHAVDWVRDGADADAALAALRALVDRARRLTG